MSGVELLKREGWIQKRVVAVKDVFEGDEACCNGLREILQNVGVQAVVNLQDSGVDGVRVCGGKWPGVGWVDDEFQFRKVRCGSCHDLACAEMQQ